MSNPNYTKNDIVFLQNRIMKLLKQRDDLLEACKHVIKEAKNVKGKMFSLLPVLNAIIKAEQK